MALIGAVRRHKVEASRAATRLACAAALASLWASSDVKASTRAVAA